MLNHLPFFVIFFRGCAKAVQIKMTRLKMPHWKDSIWYTRPYTIWACKSNFGLLGAVFKLFSMSCRMEANLDKLGIPRPSFVKAVEMSPRTGPVDANDIKRNLYGEFSSASIISQVRELGTWSLISSSKSILLLQHGAGFLVTIFSSPPQKYIQMAHGCIFVNV